MICFRGLAQTPFSREKLTINLSPFLEGKEEEETDSDSDSDNEENTNVKQNA